MANSASAPPDPGIIEAEMGRIGALMKQRQFAAALAACEVLTVLVPEKRDMLYMMARCLRHLDQPADALAVLDRLEHHHPSFSGLYQERGHCYVAAKDAPLVLDGSLVDNTVAASPDNNPAQEWDVRSSGNGLFQFVNRVSGRPLSRQGRELSFHITPTL